MVRDMLWSGTCYGPGHTMVRDIPWSDPRHGRPQPMAETRRGGGVVFESPSAAFRRPGHAVAGQAIQWLGATASHGMVRRVTAPAGAVRALGWARAGRGPPSHGWPCRLGSSGPARPGPERPGPEWPTVVRVRGRLRVHPAPVGPGRWRPSATGPGRGLQLEVAAFPTRTAGPAVVGGAETYRYIEYECGERCRVGDLAEAGLRWKRRTLVAGPLPPQWDLEEVGRRSVSVYIYIYIYIEREREREKLVAGHH
jgi:hypothetical protein